MTLSSQSEMENCIKVARDLAEKYKLTRTWDGAPDQVAVALIAVALFNKGGAGE